MKKNYTANPVELFIHSSHVIVSFLLKHYSMLFLLLKGSRALCPPRFRKSDFANLTKTIILPLRGNSPRCPTLALTVNSSGRPVLSAWYTLSKGCNHQDFPPQRQKPSDGKMTEACLKKRHLRMGQIELDTSL